MDLVAALALIKGATQLVAALTPVAKTVIDGMSADDSADAAAQLHAATEELHAKTSALHAENQARLLGAQ